MTKPTHEIAAALETAAHPRRRFPFLIVLVSLAVGFTFVPEKWSGPWLDAIQFLRLSEIIVETEAPLTDKEVRSWLPPIEGQNILRISSRRLVTLLKDRPWVNEVSVRKVLPGRIVVSVHTRVPAVIAVSQNRSYFMDEDGFWIDRVGFRAGERLDFPVVQVEKETDWITWKIKDVLELVRQTEKELGKRHAVSQVVLGQFPTVRVFLERPRGLEITFSMETWRDQIPRLKYLLENPPHPTSAMRRVDLMTPKKAVVRLTLSN